MLCVSRLYNSKKFNPIKQKARTYNIYYSYFCYFLNVAIFEVPAAPSMRQL